MKPIVRAADARAVVVLHARAIAAGDDDLSAVGCFEEAGGVQQRRLAGAGRPDQRHGFALVQLRGGARQHLDLARALMEGAPEVDEAQDDRVGRRARLRGEILHGCRHS